MVRLRRPHQFNGQRYNALNESSVAVNRTVRARLVIRSWELVFIGNKTDGFLAARSSKYQNIRCTKPRGLILSTRLRISFRTRRRTWVVPNILQGSSRRGSGFGVPVVIVIIPANELILISIERSSTTRVEYVVSGTITPITSWVKLCNSIVGSLLCIRYVRSSLISVSSIVVGELSRSLTRSSAFVIIVRERHASFSHHSVLYSFDFFISNFPSAPARSVSVGAAVIAKPRGVLSALSVRIRLSSVL